MNTNSILTKAQQRMYFIRQLMKFSLRREILIQFYRAVIESVLCFSLPVWYGSTTQDQKRCLNRVVSNVGESLGASCLLRWRYSLSGLSPDPGKSRSRQIQAVCLQIQAVCLQIQAVCLQIQAVCLQIQEVCPQIQAV